MNVAFSQPHALWLLPLALLPLARVNPTVLRYSTLSLIPRDVLSSSVFWLLRIACTLAIAAIVLGLAGLYRSEVQVERIGKGAQIVVLLDRSRSMDESFSGGRVNVDPTLFANEEKRREIKGSVARRLLAEFVAKRPQDLFGWVVFSAKPLRVLEFTQNQEAVQAAIAAGNVGKGLSDTDIASGLLTAVSYFDDRPYTGSRIIMLVSDGGARIDITTRQKIAYLIKKNRVSVYWIYLRSYRSQGLTADTDLPDDAQDAAPEHFLHKFFSGIGTPYRAYEAEEPSALARAINDVNRLENLPMQFNETLPRLELDRWCYIAAAALLAVVTAARALEIRAWR